MANYIPYARTNYFRVSDREGFDAWINSLYGLDVHHEKDGTICILFDEGIPFYHYDDETDQERDVNFMVELSEFLADGEVAIAMEVGFEKMRYLNGFAEAVNSDGESIEISLNDIYKHISEQWKIPLNKISPCEY